MQKFLMIATVPSMIGQFNMENIRLLLNMNYEVHVACNFNDRSVWTDERVERFKDELEALGVNPIQVDFARSPFHLVKLIKSYCSVRKLLTKEKYDTLHCHTPVAGMISRLAAIRTGVKTIYTAHGFHFFKGAPLKNWLIFYPIEKLLSRVTDCLITINREDYQLAAEKFKMKKLELVNGVGVDFTRFAPISSDEKEAKKKQLGFENFEHLLICVGELNSNKNQTILIEAMKEIVKFFPRVGLLLVGRGVLHDEYQRQVDSSNLSYNVKLLGFRTDVPDLMQISDIALSSSYREGLPVNVIEALGVGMPLIVSDCRGNRDLVKENQNGFILNQEDTESWVRKISYLLENDNIRNKFGLSGLELSKTYSDGTVRRQMRLIYEN